jgi:hypothetical protein
MRVDMPKEREREKSSPCECYDLLLLSNGRWYDTQSAEEVDNTQTSRKPYAIEFYRVG